MHSDDLKKAGLKVTAARVKILDILADSQRPHKSAEEVYQALLAQGADIGLATVYRVLTQCETAGLVHRHHFEGGHSVFELNQGEHHDHLVCVRCGRVEEFMDSVIESRQTAIAEQYGFTMTDHQLTIYGFCKKCQSEAACSAV